MKKNNKTIGFNDEKSDIERITEIDTGDGSDVSDDVLPDTFGGDEGKDKKKKAKKKKMGLRKKLIIMLSSVAVLVIAFIVVYFTVIKPMYDDIKEKEEATKAPKPMIEGEVRDPTNNIDILLYELINRTHTQRVTVSCEDPLLGFEFNLIRNDKGEFYLKEHGAFAPVTVATSIDVVSAAGHTVISDRVEIDCTDFSPYGLDEASYPRKVTIESTDGAVYSYYLGDMIPSKGGYYCREEGRNTVYIMGSTGLSCIMGTSVNLIQPILGPAIDGNNALMMDQFVLTKNGQRFVSISYEAADTADIRQSSYKMNFPANYIVNDDNFSSGVLSLLASLEGYMVVAAGDGTADGMLYKNTALMSQFGFYDLDNPPYEVYYELGDLAGYIMFTQSGSDAYYYAYSLVYDTIVLIEKSSVPFLEWDLLEFVSDRIFYEYIGNVSSLSISGKINYTHEDLPTEYTVNEKFLYSFDEKGILQTKALSTGITFSGNKESYNYIQAFYMSALMVDIGGYISEKEVGFDMTDKEAYARFTIEYVDGETRTYVFYKFSGYCYFTIDGSGEFYVNTPAVNKLLVNAVRAANNKPVDINAEYPDMPDEFING